MNPGERSFVAVIAFTSALCIAYLLSSSEPDLVRVVPSRVTTSVEPVRAAQVSEPAAVSTTVAAVPPPSTGPRSETMTAGSGSPVEDLIRLRFIQLGGPSVAEQAVRVARCESHLDPAARSGAHWGLFQISDRYHGARVERLGYSWPDLLRAGPNIEVAADLFMEQGWTPWSCRP